MATTIKDIAEYLHVSPSTVSMVLNNRPGISEERRQQVLYAMNQLGYTRTAKNPVENESGQNIGLIIFKNTGEIVSNSVFYTSFIDHVEHELRKTGNNLFFNQLWNDSSIIDHLNNIQKKCSGLIIVAMEASSEDIMRLFEPLTIPRVIIGNYVSKSNIDTVCVNNRRGIQMAVEHLYQLGHREIGFIGSSIPVKTFINRGNCCRRFLENLHLAYNPQYFLTLDYGEQKSYDSMCAWLKAGNTPPSAFIAANDVLAASAVQALVDQGFRVPDDVSMVGFDDQRISVMSKPQLTTVSVPTATYAHSAVYLLMQRLTAMDASYPGITIATGVSLEVRDSTAKYFARNTD